MRFRAKLWSIVIIMMCILPIFAGFFTDLYKIEEGITPFTIIERTALELNESGYIPAVIQNIYFALADIGIFIPEYVKLIIGLTIMVELMELMLEAILFLPRLCKKLMRKFEEK